MSRTNVQFVLGLALGFLTIAVVRNANGESEHFRPASFISAAAATMIAPRFWWMGIAALWIGQTAGRFAAGTSDADVFTTMRTVIGDSAPQVLVGAILGGALWYAVDLRRKRASASRQSACEPELVSLC